MNTMDQRIVDATNHMICEICTQAQKKRAPSTRALLALFSRIAGSWSSLCVLVMTARTSEQLDARANDCAAILRCMYDAFIQAAYIATKPGALGELYLNYEHVERFLAPKEIVKQDNRMARIVASSPMRKAGEKRNRREFDRVKSAYLTNKRNVQKHWYRGTLFSIAEKVGKREADEYAWFVGRTNSSVHSGPFATLCGPPMRDARIIEQIALYIVGRAGKLLVDVAGIHLDEDGKDIIKKCSDGILDLPDS